MIYVHCRSHVLQLCLVKACHNTPGIKRVVSVLGKLFTLFRGSAKRLNVLHNIEEEIDKCSHKLVQPGDTRWLSHEASVSVVCKHYSAICMALEHIYQDAGNLSSDAGGLLLTMRKDSTIFIMALLSMVLKPLARLSKALQSASDDITHAVQNANNVMKELKDLIASKDMQQVTQVANDMIQQAKVNNVLIELDTSMPRKTCITMCMKYVKAIVTNMEDRFSDDVGKLGEIHSILKDKPETADFSNIAKILGVSQSEMDYEWRMLRRFPCDLSTRDSLLNLSTSNEKKILFPTFSEVVTKLLLLPIGTAEVERSFSTMNRILNSDRCRLTPDHVNILMQISIEGPCIPDVRDGTDDEELALRNLINLAYKWWLRENHRR